MTNRRVIWTLIVADVRSLIRERGQVAALALGTLGVFVPLVVGAGLLHHLANEIRAASTPPKTTTVEQSAVTTQAPAALPARAADILVWAVIGATTLFGGLAAVTYGMGSALASWVAERENRTIELLLMSSMSDKRLYLLRWLSVLLPVCALSYALALPAVATLAWAASDMLALLNRPEVLSTTSSGRWVLAMALALPLPPLVNVVFVNMATCISLRSETMKGANAILGLFFSGIWIAPLILGWYLLPDVFKGFVTDALRRWVMEAPLGWQYASLVGMLATIGAATLALGYRWFDRDRLLT